MEKKEEMKKRGLRSTDLADAICLTLAEPIVEFADDEDLGWEPGDARVGL